MTYFKKMTARAFHFYILHTACYEDVLGYCYCLSNYISHAEVAEFFQGIFLKNTATFLSKL